MLITKFMTCFYMFQMLFLNIADTSASKLEPFIIGGQDVSVEDWPFITFVEISHFGIAAFGCGGSLLSSQTALTAAHCLDDVTEKKKSMAGIGFKIYMGHTFYARAKMARDVIDYESHNDYSPDDHQVISDIAIMFLDRPVRFSATVQKVILQRRFNVKQNINLAVAGWGSTDLENTRNSNKLKAVYMTPKRFKRCTSLQKVICAVASNDYEYPYKGDSGGPLVNAENHHQVGVVSFRDLPTGISVFTNVPEYYDWIEENQYKLFKRNCRN